MSILESQGPLYINSSVVSNYKSNKQTYQTLQSLKGKPFTICGSGEINNMYFVRIASESKEKVIYFEDYSAAVTAFVVECPSTKRIPEKEVAICVSGQPRNIHKNSKNFLKQLVIPNKAAIFMHFWEPATDEEKKTLEDALEILQPNDYIIEPQKTFKEFQHVLSINRFIFRIFSMFYSINQANSLRLSWQNQNNFTYKTVVRYRTDCFLKKCLIIPKNLDDCVYLPEEKNLDYGGFNDQIGFGSDYIMNIYSSTINELIDIANAIKKNKKQMKLFKRVIERPEKLLKHTINKNNLLIKRFPIKYGLTSPTWSVRNFIGSKVEEKKIIDKRSTLLKTPPAEHIFDIIKK